MTALSRELPTSCEVRGDDDGEGEEDGILRVPKGTA